GEGNGRADIRRARRGRLRHRGPRRPAGDGARRLRSGGPRLRPLPARGRAAAGSVRGHRSLHRPGGDEVSARRLRALPGARPLGGGGEAGRLRGAGPGPGAGRLHRRRRGDGADARRERPGGGRRRGRVFGAPHRQPRQLPRAARRDVRPRARAREGEDGVRIVRYGTAAWRRYREGLPRTSTPRPATERAVASILRAVRRDGGAGAYPSSVLMSAIPARVAGVPRLQAATPPRTLESSPGVAAALVLVGLEGAVFRVGGAQAVAAFAFGTATVPAVSKIVGPGNAFVAAAKRQVRGMVEIDQEAGPSEVVVLADDSADAMWVAADLLAQAEHGSGDETAVLVTPSEALAAEVRRAMAAGLGSVSNAAAARR